MSYPEPHHLPRPVWSKLATAWHLELAAIPTAMHYLWVRIAAEDGIVQILEEQIRSEGRRLIYVDVEWSDRRLQVDRPHPWRPLDEMRALRQMREVLGEPLVFGS